MELSIIYALKGHVNGGFKGLYNIQLCNFVISVYTSAMVEMSNSIQTSMKETRQKYLQLFLCTRYQSLTRHKYLQLFLRSRYLSLTRQKYPQLFLRTR